MVRIIATIPVHTRTSRFVRPFFIALVTLLSLSACTGSQAATEAVTPEPASETPAPVATAPAVEALEPPSNGSEVAQVPSSPTPLPSGTPTPTVTPPPSATPTSTPTPRPTLRQLTSGGCCVQPFFSPDSQAVLFIDKPTETDPIGIYRVDLTDPQATPVLDSEIVGFRSPNRSIVATLDGGDLARFLNEESGERWTVDTGGNWPRFSPDSQRILWTATDREGPYDQRQSDIWLAELDGSNPRLLLSLRGGGFAGWLPEGRRILLVSRDTPGEETRTLSVYDLETDRRTNLFRHKRIRGTEISPESGWIAFFVTFGEADEPENGIWVISTDGTFRQKLEVPGFGAFRWRDENTLLYIPMRASAEASMQLWSVDIPGGQSQPLTDPDELSFSISNGDWTVSPDGRTVIFVSSADQNIWSITLP